MAREHHFSFAKRLIPTETFRSPDKMFAELTGPQREAFVFFLWTEVGKSVSEKLPHVGLAPGGMEMAKLDVVGRIKSGELEVVVLSMPPALEANEALFLAVVRGGGRLSVFFYERCLDAAGTGVHASEAVLAEVKADGSRSNFGFKPGIDLQAFKTHLGQVLGISLDGLETSLPQATVEEFVAAGGAKAKRSVVSSNPYMAPSGNASAGAGVNAPTSGPKKGGLLELLLLIRAGLPLVLFLIAKTVPGIMAPFWQFIRPVYMLLSFAIAIALLIWLYQVYDSRRGQTPFGPGMAVGGWFIPVANLILIPLIVRGAYKTVVGAGGGLLVLGWWVCWLVETTMQMFTSMMMNGVMPPPVVMDFLKDVWVPPVPTLVTVGAYGILWFIVKSVRARL